MTQKEFEVLISKYIFSLGRDSVPNTMLWMAIDPNMSDLDLHMKVLGVLKRAGLLEEKFNLLTLTPAGLALYEQINRIVLATQPQPPKSNAS